ncbi:MAG: gluconate 2-dehydrogenase subunit 3 family protein, partial [Rhodospirillales bacterium]
RSTEEGYFADPIYGGNRDKVGWKLLGFPGLPSGDYRHLIGSSEPYRAEPVSVLDVQTGRVRVDAEGFPKHTIIERDRGN